MVGVAEDITKHKLAEAELNKALEKERELNELKSRFISMASHDFRTPLTSILVSTEFLEYYGKNTTSDKKQKIYDRIKQATTTMTQLLDDVLIIGKAEAGKLEYQPTLLQLGQFCHELVEEVETLLSNRHSLDFYMPEECSTLNFKGDKKLLHQVFSNLLSNAIKYSPAGGVIRFEAQCEAGQLIFRVQDQGLGIPAEDLPRLFEAFHRAHNVGSIPGTGLGLAIVKNCVDAHGGQIQVSSQQGQGTTVTVTIPNPSS